MRKQAIAPEVSQIDTPGLTALFQWGLFLISETIGISQGSLRGTEPMEWIHILRGIYKISLHGKSWVLQQCLPVH